MTIENYDGLGLEDWIIANGYGVNLIHTKGPLVVAGDRGQIAGIRPTMGNLCDDLLSAIGMSGKISSGMADEEELTAGEWWI